MKKRKKSPAPLPPAETVEKDGAVFRRISGKIRKERTIMAYRVILPDLGEPYKTVMEETARRFLGYLDVFSESAEGIYRGLLQFSPRFERVDIFSAVDPFERTHPVLIGSLIQTEKGEAAFRRAGEPLTSPRRHTILKLRKRKEKEKRHGNDSL